MSAPATLAFQGGGQGKQIFDNHAAFSCLQAISIAGSTAGVTIVGRFYDAQGNALLLSTGKTALTLAAPTTGISLLAAIALASGAPSLPGKAVGFRGVVAGGSVYWAPTTAISDATGATKVGTDWLPTTNDNVVASGGVINFGRMPT